MHNRRVLVDHLPDQWPLSVYVARIRHLATERTTFPRVISPFAALAIHQQLAEGSVFCRSSMVNELELAVHGTSCSYNAKRENCTHRQNARGHSGLPSLYFAYVEPELSDHAVGETEP